MAEDNGLRKIYFSIGAKLIIIITFIVLVSLGSIIALASWLTRADLQIIAEEDNFETNRRTAMAAEVSFENIHSNSLVLMRTLFQQSTLLQQSNISSAGTRTALVNDAINFFFERNPHVASVFFTVRDNFEVITNNDFFASKNLDLSLGNIFMDEHDNVMQRAQAGETVLMNASPYFGSSLLALFFPWQEGGAGILFSPENLNDSFNYGVNQSYLLNDYGDILIHSDFELVRIAKNVADQEFIKYVWNSQEKEAQTLYRDEKSVRFFGAFRKLDIAGATVITSIEYEKVFESINATTRRNIYLTITVLSISIILIWFFAKSISVPLKTLAVAAGEIEGGKFDLSLNPKGYDEIGVLTSSFQRMTSALRIFGRFTNRDIALRAMRGEIKPGGFRKEATIFFSDIRNFTSISEEFTNIFADSASEKIVNWLNEYFTYMIECVEKTSGVVDKFIGDAVMAHWGTAYTTGSLRKDAYNCVKAALYMRHALRRMNKGRKKDNHEKPRIRIGMGINSGTVTAGQLGSDRRMEYTVVGDPVNLASRIESLTKEFGTDILIAENTWKLVRKRFITVEMSSVTVRGKEKPVRIFAVINFAKNTKGPKSIVRLRRLLGIKAPANLKLDPSSAEPKYIFTGKRHGE